MNTAWLVTCSLPLGTFYNGKTFTFWSHKFHTNDIILSRIWPGTLMRPFPGKISTSNMPLKWRHETNEMVTNNTMMGWNNNSGEDNYFKRKNNNKLYNANRDMASSSMHETTGFENQTRESIPTLRRPIKLVNMVNSFSYCSWITYKTQKVLKIKRYECTGLPRNSHFFVTYLLLITRRFRVSPTPN